MTSPDPFGPYVLWLFKITARAQYVPQILMLIRNWNFTIIFIGRVNKRVFDGPDDNFSRIQGVCSESMPLLLMLFSCFDTFASKLAVGPRPQQKETGSIV